MTIDGTNLVALLGILSTGALGYLGYRKAKKADTATEKASAVDQIINGLNLLVDQLQEENVANRGVIKELKDALQKALDERDKYKRDLQALKRAYGQASK